MVPKNRQGLILKLVELVAQLRGGGKSCVVIGPPRSGTRIIAKILARELKFKYVDETDFGVIQWTQFLCLAQKNTVVHAPALTELAERMPSQLHLVFVMRDNDEIRRSRKRINWQGGQRERNRIVAVFGKFDDDVLDATKRFWREKQQPLLGKRGLTVDYASATDYAEFVPRNERSNFKWFQTKK